MKRKRVSTSEQRPADPKKSKKTSYFDQTVKFSQNKHQNHVFRHAKKLDSDGKPSILLAKGNIQVQCAFSDLPFVYSTRKQSIWFKGRDKFPYVGQKPLLLQYPLKKHIKEICSLCIYANSKLCDKHQETRKRLIQNKNVFLQEKKRLEILGFELVEIRKSRPKQAYGTSEYASDFTELAMEHPEWEIPKGVIIYQVELDNLLREASSGCQVCKKMISQHAAWNLLTENIIKTKKENLVFSRTFECETRKHRFTWINNNLIGRHLFAAQYVEAVVEKKFTRVLDNLNIAYEAYRPWLKPQMRSIIATETARCIARSVKILNEKYQKGGKYEKEFVVQTDIQWKTKQGRGTRAVSAHGTMMGGAEALIIDSEVSHNCDLLNDDGEFYRTLEVAHGFGYPSMDSLKESLDVLQELSGGVAMTFESYDENWLEKVKTHGQGLLNKKKLKKQEKNQSRMNYISGRYPRVLEELSTNFLEDMNTKSIEMEFYLRSLGLIVSGNLMERKGNLEDYLQEKKDSEADAILLDDEKGEVAVCHCLEKLSTHNLFKRYHKILPNVVCSCLVLDGCKASQAAGVTYFQPLNPFAILGLDVFHGSSTYSNVWESVCDEFPVFDNIHYFFFFEEMERIGLEARKLYVENDERISFMKKEIMKIGRSVVELVTQDLPDGITLEEEVPVDKKWSWDDESKLKVEKFILEKFEENDLSTGCNIVKLIFFFQKWL